MKYFALIVPVKDSPEQIQGAAKHSGGLSGSLHTALVAEVSGANLSFLQHWNVPQTCDKGKYKEGENHRPLNSVFYFFSSMC